MVKVMSGFRLLLDIIICVVLTEFVIGKPLSEPESEVPDISFCEQFSQLNQTFHIRRQEGSITTSKTTLGRLRRQTQGTYVQGATLKDCFDLLSQDKVPEEKLFEVLLCNEILNVVVRKCNENPGLVLAHLENEGAKPCDVYMNVLSYVGDDEFEMAYNPLNNQLVQSVVQTHIKQPPGKNQIPECPLLCASPSAASFCHLAVELYLSPQKELKNPGASPQPVDGGADGQNKDQITSPPVSPQPTNKEAEQEQAGAPNSLKGNPELNTQVNPDNEGGDGEMPEGLPTQKENSENIKLQNGITPAVSESGNEKLIATTISPVVKAAEALTAAVEEKANIKNNPTIKNITSAQVSNITNPTNSSSSVRPPPDIKPAPSNQASQGDKSKTGVPQNPTKEDPTKSDSGEKFSPESQQGQPKPDGPQEPAAKTTPSSDSNKPPAVANPPTKDIENKEANIPPVTQKEKPVTTAKPTEIPVTTKASPVAETEAEKNQDDIEKPPGKEETNFEGATDDDDKEPGDPRDEGEPQLGVDHKNLDENQPMPEEQSIVSDIRVPNSGFPEQQDSHFFAYFLTVIIIIILGYLVVHNKQKILGLIVEGRGGQRRRSHNYRKLDTEGSKGSGMIF